MDPTRIDELIALAALGEITPDEEAELDAALAADAAVAAELDADLEVAARLQSAHRTPPPAALKANVMAAIDALDEPERSSDDVGNRQPDDRVVTSLESRRSMRRRRMWQPLAAAAAVVMLVAGGLLVANRGGDDAPSFETVAEAPDAQTRPFAGDLGGMLSVVHSPRNDAFVLTGVDVPSLSAAETYQLWFVDGDDVMSVGLFRPDVDGLVAVVFDGFDPSDVVVGVTVEPAAGSEMPTLPIVATA